MSAFIGNSLRVASRGLIPAASVSLFGLRNESASCEDAAPQTVETTTSHHEQVPKPESASYAFEQLKAGMVGGGDEQGSFHGLFPMRQLWQPARPCE